MNSQIETFFSEIEKLIEFQLCNGIQIQEQEIKLKFVEGKALIDKLEEEDEEQHGFYTIQPTPEVVEPIRKAFENLHETPKTFERYQKLINCENSLCESLNVLIDEELIVLDQLNNEDDDLKEFANNLASQTVYSKRLDFIHNILNSPNKKAILFSNILFTEGEINKRYRELASCFHPDRTTYSNILNGLHSNDQYLGIELFRIIIEIKEALLTDLETTSKSQGVINFYEKNANKNFNIANDYQDIKEIPSSELKRLSVSYGLLAHKEYRAACKVADVTRELKKQIKLRGIMALSFSVYLSGRPCRSKKKIFDKVKETSQIITDIKLKDDLGNSHALVKVLSAELMFKPDRQIVSYQASQEDILRSNEQSVGHKIVGPISLAAVTIGTGAFVAASTIFAPAVSTLWLVPLMSLLYHLNPWKQGTMLLSEPEIREKLNKIIKNALDAYDEGNYQNFFDLLLLSSNKIKIPDSDISPAVLRAKIFDDRIRELREKNLKSLAKSVFHNIKDFLFLRSHSEMAKEYKDDAQKMPFRSRLEEMPERISKLIKESRDSISNNYQFTSSTESRLEVLEDFLWIMNGEVPESPEIPSICSMMSVENQPNQESDRKYDKKYMDYLNDKLQRVSDNNERTYLHTKLADHFVKLAEEDKDKLLSSLRHWYHVKEHYEKVREVDPNNLSATLSFAKCFIASYKEIKYDKAMELIIEALKLDSQNILVTKQKRLLDRLKEYIVESRINCHKKKIYDEGSSIKTLHRYNDDNSVYRILSIDGGGVRGFIGAALSMP
ncbi:24639_t:CDS:10, partial [Gigaspora margarita]